jgi:imidazole glycerol phosphate synthase glutamine amidotransferase subunit
MITVLDYDAGNLASLAGALERLHLSAKVAKDASEVPANPGVLVLPGVGHFHAAKEALVARGLWDVCARAVRENKPLVGICLGMQLLAEGSDEAPGVTGLGAFRGHAARLEPGPATEATAVKVPHMGWSRVEGRTLPSYLGEVPEWLYFVHSYAVPITEDTALARGNVFGVQAHPERSGERGQRLLGDVLVGLAQKNGASCS